MSAHVLLNLPNEFGKSDLPSILSLFCNKFNKFNNTGVHMLDSFYDMTLTGPRCAVGNVSGYRFKSDCRSKSREFNPGPVPYFRGD